MMWVSFPGGHDRGSPAQRRRKFCSRITCASSNLQREGEKPPARVSTASCCASRLNSAIANGPWSRPPSVRRLLAFPGGEEFRHVRRVARQTPRSRTGAAREDARDTIIALDNRGTGKAHAGARSSGLSARLFGPVRNSEKVGSPDASNQVTLLSSKRTATASGLAAACKSINL